MYRHTGQVVQLCSKRLMLLKNEVDLVTESGIIFRSNYSTVSRKLPTSYASNILKVRQQSYEAENTTSKLQQWKKTSHLLMSVKAIGFSTHSGSTEVIAFINSQDDLERFIHQLKGLLQAKGSRNFWGSNSQERLEALCHLFLEKNCDCRNIYSFFKDNPNVLKVNEETLAYIVQYLCDLGFKSNRLLYILNKRPQIWRLSHADIHGRVEFLWNLGLTDGQLKTSVVNCPDILTVKRKKVEQILALLRKLQFTSKDICQIVADSPQVFEESEYETELRLQYVLFAMGITNYKEILKAKIFNYTYEHIRLRHLLLERLGLYQVPDKHGKTKFRNPALCRIIDSTDKRFASSCANISLEEFESFSQMLKEEQLEEEEENLSDEEEEENFRDEDDEENLRDEDDEDWRGDDLNGEDRKSDL